MCDLDCYNKAWKKVISPLLAHYRDSIDWIEIKPNMEETIKENYIHFNQMCKSDYMDPSIVRLDAHKVSACYMLAILKSCPFEYSREADDNKLIVAIEQLTLTVGLSILRSFLICDRDINNQKKSKEQFEKDRMIFHDGFVFPDSTEVNHGEYRNNFALELYFTRNQENYNILSLAHSLYLLELYNRQKWEITNKS